MEEYVVPEFYDVLVGGTNADGSTGGQGGQSASGAGATASWDLSNGVTGNGWDLPSYIGPQNVYGATNEEVKSKIEIYLSRFGGYQASEEGFSNCVKF